MLTSPLRAYRTSESTCVAWHGPKQAQHRGLSTGATGLEPATSGVTDRRPCRFCSARHSDHGFGRKRDSTGVEYLRSCPCEEDAVARLATGAHVAHRPICGSFRESLG